MTYDRDAAAAAELAAWRQQMRDKRQREIVQVLLAIGAGIVIGIGFFQKSTYERARNNPEEAAQALCGRGYEVIEPGIGSVC